MTLHIQGFQMAELAFCAYLGWWVGQVAIECLGFAIGYLIVKLGWKA